MKLIKKLNPIRKVKNFIEDIKYEFERGKRKRILERDMIIYFDLSIQGFDDALSKAKIYDQEMKTIHEPRGVLLRYIFNRAYHYRE